MTTDPNTLAERIWEAVAKVRDQHPRVHNDAPTDDVVAAVLPLVRAAQADALRGWALGVESELNASRAHGINLGEWERGLRSGVRQALHVADQIEKENTDG